MDHTRNPFAGHTPPLHATFSRSLRRATRPTACLPLLGQPRPLSPRIPSGSSRGSSSLAGMRHPRRKVCGSLRMGSPLWSVLGASFGEGVFGMECVGSFWIQVMSSPSQRSAIARRRCGLAWAGAECSVAEWKMRTSPFRT